MDLTSPSLSVRLLTNLAFARLQLGLTERRPPEPIPPMQNSQKTP